jgi:hypothetical protein
MSELPRSGIRQRTVEKHRAVSRADLGTGDTQRTARAEPEIRGQAVPRDSLGDDPLERRHIDEPADHLRALPAARAANALRESERAHRDPQQIRHREADDVGEPHLPPGIGETCRARLAGKLRAGGGVGGMDRTDRGSTDHVEVGARWQLRDHLLEQVGQDSRFVRPACTPTREDETDPARPSHAPSRPPSVRRSGPRRCPVGRSITTPLADARLPRSARSAPPRPFGRGGC